VQNFISMTRFLTFQNKVNIVMVLMKACKSSVNVLILGGLVL